MAKRVFDIVCSALALLSSAPVLGLAAIGIRLSSRGPILFRAARVGLGGEDFVMHKFRTMHVRCGDDSVITGSDDKRVFPFGSLLRQLKIDEIPQFHDVLWGRMSVVGPRPEDPRIVERHYTPRQMETLRVKPGLASPGSIYNYTHGDEYFDDEDTERAYVERLLPIKLALDQVYVARASFTYDLRIVARTVAVVVMSAAGCRRFAEPPEMIAALALLRAPP